MSLLLLAPAADAKPDRERIESVELDATGTAGVIRTTPEFMRGGDAEYRFGKGACKAYRLGDRTLEQLMDAMRERHFVRITADVKGEAKCVRAVTFFAPDA